MTRTKTAASTLAQEDTAKATMKKPAGERMLRELQTVLLDNTTRLGAAGGRSRTRASVPGNGKPDAAHPGEQTGVARGRKGLSAPLPQPDSQVKEDVAAAEPPPAAAPRKGASSKRAPAVEPAEAVQAVDDLKPPGNKKRKTGRSSERQRQSSDDGAEEGSNMLGSASGAANAGPDASAAITGDKPRAQASKSQDSRKSGGGTEAAANGAGDASGSQPAPTNNAAAKKPRNGKAQQAKAAQEAEQAAAVAPAAPEAAPVAPPPPPAVAPAPLPAAAPAPSQPAAHARRGRPPLSAPAPAPAPAPPQPQRPAGEASTQAGAAATAAPPAVSRPPAAAPAQDPKPPADAPVARGSAEAAPALTRAGSGSGPSGSTGSAGPAAPRALPATGTTPVKAFVPAPLPRMDDIGQRERGAVVELQRQLMELRTLYDELKATKIQDLEKVLAEQVEIADEQCKHAEQKAALWKAAAEHAEQKAQDAGSQETATRVAALEAQVEHLLQERGDLQIRLAEQARELALTQQHLHDLRAQLMLQGEDQERRQGRGQGQAGAERGALDEEAGPGGEGEGEEARHGMELDGEGFPGAGDGEGGADGLPDAGDGEEQEPSPLLARRDDATPAAGPEGAPRGVGQQFPTPSPGVGTQYPTPGMPLLRLQGLLGSGGAALTGSASRSRGPGVSTECLRVVQMLPSLRAPTPSIESRLAQGAVPLETQADAAPGGAGTTSGVTPHAAQTTEGGQAGSNKGRRSTGSPIDGLCAVGPLQPGAAATNTTGLAAEISAAHGMGAPEAFTLRGPHQEQHYSFVDLNPASARKAPRPADTAALLIGTAAAMLGDAHGAAAGDEKTQQGPDRRPLDDAGRVATAAALPLPNSPSAALMGRLGMHAPMATAGSGVLNGLTSPGGRGMGSTAAGLSPSGRLRAAAEAGGLHSGSVMSNQDSSTVSGMVARAMALLAATGPDLALDPSARSGAAGAAPPGLAQPQASPRPGGAGPSLRSPGSATKLPGVPLGRTLARTPVAAAQQPQPPARSPLPAQQQPRTAAAAAVPDTAAQVQGPQEEQEQQAPAGPQGTPGPTPRTARLIMYERMLDWHVDTVCLQPELCRLTHASSGVAIELREVDLDDDEAGGEVLEEGAADAAAPPKYFIYTPLALGSVEDAMPAFLKESMQISALQRRELLDRLSKAIKAGLAKKAQA
ncbi:hypothetical protein HYH03_006032 [Edaphochlamys debaryana]|uniref:Uncharacterized protein n=1 Tax=Edaphochlamys debaryana TaxID=47281 RepID=A0A835Y6T1_9CHLO|nr:hypothetical protein HYH03_006032 [Edaphochlamys debaryana]|eukprot:KAG2495788.1 hypothetical protein HYH03_006032 [Edaphochlamys debaryana]